MLAFEISKFSEKIVRYLSDKVAAIKSNLFQVT